MVEDYFYLGKITKIFGLKGEVLVFLDTDEPHKYYNLKSVFFDIEGEPIPFFIQSIKQKSNNQLIVKFDEINLENVNSFVNISLYLPLSMLPPLEGNKFYFHEINGYIIMDVNYGELGFCDHVLEFPQQAVFQIKNPKGEILIPIVDDYIKKVDKENKIIEVETPAGLIDIYLQ